MQKIMKDNGITLIALVVTIIILIILAGISISLVFGEYGIIQRAKDSKETQIKAEILQELELQKGHIMIDGKGYTDLGLYLEHIQKTDLNGHKVTSIEYINDETSGIWIDNKYYYTAAQIDNNVVINAIGYARELKPEIQSFIITEITSNSIEVEVKARMADTYKFYIDGEKVETIKKDKKQTNEIETITYTYTNLKSLTEEDVNYTLKIIAKNKNGQDEKIEETRTEEIAIPLITVEEAETWTNKTKTISITTDENYKTIYTLDGTVPSATNGIEYTEKFTVDKNCIITAVYLDSTNQIGASDVNEVTKIDKDIPTIGTVTGSTATGNTGTVTVSSISDASGSGISAIYISTSNTTPTIDAEGWVENTAATYTETVSENTTYYVWVKDAVGNISSVKSCTVSGIVSKVSITAFNNISLLRGNTGTPTLTYTGTAKSIAYSSSDTTKATINSTSGLVTANATNTGSSTLTVKITNYDGTTVSKTATATVTSGKARVGTKDFASLANAINAVPTNGTNTTITMQANTSESATIASGKNITLALNSKTITGSITNNGTLTVSGTGTITNGGGSTITNNRTLNVTGGTIKSATMHGLNNCGGTVTVSGGTITSSAAAGIALKAGTIDIKGGTVSSTSSEGKSAIYIEEGTLNISDGTISNTGAAGVVAMQSGTGVVNISGGTITGYHGITRNAGSTGKLTITGGTISSTRNTIRMNGGSGALNISGGTIKATGAYVAVYTDSAYTGTVTTSGASEATPRIESSSSKPAVEHQGSGKITINGGRFIANSTGKTNATIYIGSNCEKANIVLTSGMTINTNSDTSNRYYYYSAKTGNAYTGYSKSVGEITK